MKILIVEDNKDLAELIKEKTDEIGFESICEYSAGEAFNFLKMNSPDLIVLDYFLPDNNALEFLKKLKSENISTPPFIVSTGQGDERIAVEMMKFGARDYIVKDSHFFDILPEVIKRTAREIENENKRKQAESALEQSLERIKALLNANPDLMFVFDRNNRIIDYHSTTGENGLFVKPQYFIEKTIDSIFPKEIAELTVQKINNVLENGKLEYLNYELEFNGLKRSYEARFVLCGENEVLSIVRDITEQKTTEKELDKLQKQLLQAQKMESIGRLAGGVAHDFNNMLGVIINNVELAFFYVKPDDELHSILSEIKKAADKSANITKQLLAFARKQMITPKEIDVNETIENILKMLRRLIGEHINLVWRPGLQIWKIKADPSQIDQILTNLCVNARDAINGPGSIVISTENCSISENDCMNNANFSAGEFVKLSIGDTGSGIDKETQSRIFEPFFTTKEQGRGTGLGLATIYGAVKQNNGFINIISEVGKGTEFDIYLPRHLTECESAEEKNCKTLQSLSTGEETILLVEDEPAILKAVSKLLQKLGYTLLSANNPVEAIKIAKNFKRNIHLLITDIVMPEMNGRVLAKELNSIYPDIKTIFMSGYTDDIIKPEDLENQKIRFIQKPFNLNDLSNEVREAFEK